MSDPAVGRPCMLEQLTPSKPRYEQAPNCVLTAQAFVPKDCPLLLWLIHPFSPWTHYSPITAPPINVGLLLPDKPITSVCLHSLFPEIRRQPT